MASERKISPVHNYAEIIDESTAVASPPPATTTTGATSVYASLCVSTLEDPNTGKSTYESCKLRSNATKNVGKSQVAGTGAAVSDVAKSQVADTGAANRGFLGILLITIIFLCIAFLCLCLGLSFAFIEIFALKSELTMLKHTKQSSLNASTLSEIEYCGVAECNDLRLRLESTNSSLAELAEQHQQLVDTVNLGQAYSPAASCAALLTFSPSTPSGHYWVRASNGSALRVYCDMTRSCGNVTGGWVRAAQFNITNYTEQCPGDLRVRNDSGVVTCGIEIQRLGTFFCSSISFPLNGILYSRVCGRVTAYGVGSPGGFHPEQSLDNAYVSGISITHASREQHVWTLAATSSTAQCPCSANSTSPPPPAFVGQDYFCDSVTGGGSSPDFSSPLWDGAGCVSGDSSSTPSQFHKQLPEPTTDDLEMRACANEGRVTEDIAIKFFEVYVQ